MLTVGLDVHHRSSVPCVLDHHGKHVRTWTVRGHWSGLIEQLRGLGKPLQVCYEASVGYGAIYDQMSRLARRVVVAHPGQVVFQMAEVAVPRESFVAILDRIQRFGVPPPLAHRG
jgi:hypothetical protein